MSEVEVHGINYSKLPVPFSEAEKLPSKERRLQAERSVYHGEQVNKAKKAPKINYNKDVLGKTGIDKLLERDLEETTARIIRDDAIDENVHRAEVDIIDVALRGAEEEKEGAAKNLSKAYRLKKKSEEMP